MKIRHLFFFFEFVVLIALTACSSGRSDMNNTPALDQTNTPVIDPTGTPTPEPTAVANVPEEPEERAPVEEEPVEAPKVSESHGVFDTETFVDNLDDFVLRADDLTYQYRLVVDGEQHLTNRKVINTLGEVEAKRYLAASKRLDGWSIELERVNKEDLTPYTIFSQIEVFETVEGAQTAFGTDWFHAYTDETREPNWIEEGCDLGDACIMYYYEKFDPTTELTTLQYEVAFVYKNVLAQVMGRSLDFDMNPDYVVEAAESLFEKIDTAPIVG